MLKARAERLVRGDSWRQAWVILDAMGPVDLTGASVRLQVRDAAGALVLTAESGDGRLAVDPPQGRIDLAMPWSETEALAPGRYLFDLELTRGVDRMTCDRAVLLVTEDVTR